MATLGKLHQYGLARWVATWDTKMVITRVPGHPPGPEFLGILAQVLFASCIFEGAFAVCQRALAVTTADHNNEPAFHRRGRAKRANARAILRVAKASSLLANHHSAQQMP